jgi:hypothetical protein
MNSRTNLPRIWHAECAKDIAAENEECDGVGFGRKLNLISDLQDGKL